MNKQELNYQYHYCKWHDETEESRLKDINSNKELIFMHQIQPKFNEAKVLDIGCGMGRFLLALRELGFSNLTGIDIDLNQAAIACKDNLNVQNIDAISFLSSRNNGPYDTIYLCDVLEHLNKDEQLQLLRLIKYNLSEEGFLYIQVPNACSPVWGYFRHIDWTHTTSFTDFSLEFILKNAGFTEINVREQYPPSIEMYNAREPFKKLYEAEFNMSKPMLGPNICAVVYNNKENNNIFFDKLWGTTLTEHNLTI